MSISLPPAKSISLPPAKSVMVNNIKHYEIRFEGTTYTCEPVGQKWRCNGVTSTLKGLKLALVSGDIPSDDGVYLEEIIEEPEVKAIGTWDCLPPCALLIERLGQYRCQSDPEIMETLDNYGWLNKDKKAVDMDKVTRALNRVKNRIQNEQRT